MIVSGVTLESTADVVLVLRLCEALVKLARPSATRALQLELHAALGGRGDDATRRATLSALLDLARGVERAHIVFALRTTPTTSDAPTTTIAVDNAAVVKLDGGLALWHDVDAFQIGAFDVALRPCVACSIVIARQ